MESAVWAVPVTSRKAWNRYKWLESQSIPTFEIPMRLIAMLAFAVSVLTGCAVYTPSGSVVVDPQGGDRGGFCPPGQAKKGNC